MYLLTLGQQILRDIWAQKFRSFLALFGITWGTLTVILLLALGHGFYQKSQQDIMKIAEGTLYFAPGITSQSYRGMPTGRNVNIKASAVLQLPAKFPDIQSTAPFLTQDATMTFQENNLKKSVVGTTPLFQTFQKLDLIDGSRFLNPVDINNHEDVAVIGYNLKEDLFNEHTALGREILIRNIPFKIVGVLQPPVRKKMRSWVDHAAIIPYTTYIDLWGNQNIMSFFVLPQPNSNTKIIERDVRTYLGYRYHFSPDDTNALMFYDTIKIFNFFNWFFVGIQLFLGLCGSLTLAVGGLGVANIMFLIVTERTKEIGLRMAVGARDSHILIQILFEALILVVLGGLFGITLSYLTVFILQFITLPAWIGKPTISLSIAFITIAVLAMIGVLAGYFPAKRASRMDPVDALGAE